MGYRRNHYTKRSSSQRFGEKTSENGYWDVGSQYGGNNYDGSKWSSINWKWVEQAPARQPAPAPRPPAKRTAPAPAARKAVANAVSPITAPATPTPTPPPPPKPVPFNESSAVNTGLKIGSSYNEPSSGGTKKFRRSSSARTFNNNMNTSMRINNQLTV